MSRRIIGVRRGSSVQERIQDPVASIPDLRLIPTTDVVDKAIVFVEPSGLYRFDYEGIGLDDGLTIIEPAVGPGRWYQISGAGGPISGLATERFRFEFPVLGNTTIADIDWVKDDLTITRIDLLVRTALTTSGLYTLAISGAGNTLLSTATVDLLSFTAGTIYELTLTGTTANLQLSDKDELEVTVLSDNIDLVGGEAVEVVIYAEGTGGGGGGGGTTIEVQEGGVAVDATVDTLNFTGAGVTVVSSGIDKVDVDIDQGVLGPGAVTAANQVALWTDGTGTAIKQSTMTVVGNDANVVGTLTAAEVVAGDLVMRSDERNALWRMIEHHDHIQVVNEKTGKKYRLALLPDED